MLQYLLTAIALLFVIEGLMPSLSPRLWRLLMVRTFMNEDHIIRSVGLVSMIIGAILMYLIHSGFFSH